VFVPNQVQTSLSRRPWTRLSRTQSASCRWAAVEAHETDAPVHLSGASGASAPTATGILRRARVARPDARQL